MASGSRGLCGQAVLKPVEGGASRETGFVMGPFLEGNPVLENEKRSGNVMRRDAQVSGWEHSSLCQQFFIRNRNLTYCLFFCLFFTLTFKAHLLSICEQNLMKYVGRTTFPMLYGRWLQLGKQQQYAVLLMPWVSLECPVGFCGFKGCSLVMKNACWVCLYTGLILRRCTLDEEGIAFWENPTYMKCISNDYRSIQTLVSFFYSTSGKIMQWRNLILTSQKCL